MPGLPAEIAGPIEPQLAEVESILARAGQECPGAVTDVLSGPWLGRGKRLRPVIAIHTARAGGQSAAAVPALGAAVELLHVASLLHDDFIDGAMTRRGHKAAHVRFSPRWALLAGDFLFARALQLSMDAAALEGVKLVVSGTRAMIEGESIEVGRAGDLDLTADEAVIIARQKTAALFGTACRLGALAGQVDAKRTEALAQFGESLGLAFQLADDVLDLIGSHEQTGKDPGTDIREGNLTLPLVYAVEELGAERSQTLLGDIFGHKDAPDDRVAAALQTIRSTQAITRARAEAEKHARAASQALDAADIALPEVRAALRACLDFAVARNT